MFLGEGYRGPFEKVTYALPHPGRNGIGRVKVCSAWRRDHLEFSRAGIVVLSRVGRSGLDAVFGETESP